VGAGFSEKQIIEAQIQQIDQALKERFPDRERWHLLDRKHDDEATFKLINGLESYFVIRLKANRRATPRNSNEIKRDSNGKAVSVKLLDASLENSLTQTLDRFVWKNRVYQQASLTTTYGKLRLGDQTYQVARIQISDRESRPIFPQPLLLLTNAAINNHQQAFQLYQRYLKRSKIEGVFKFLKEELGWEKFQIRDFLAIQNIIVLCFFVAEYFYENQPQDPSVMMLCQLAKSKGKITKHFYTKGLAIMANYLLFQQYVNEQNLSQQQVDQLINTFK
jgi:hypothetical protein